MAKVISQETFDNVVKENVVEFDLDPAEAKAETIKQLEAQGVNLNNIVTDLEINCETGNPVLNETIDQLKQYVEENNKNEEQLNKLLIILEKQALKSLSHRLLASKNEAHALLLQLLQREDFVSEKAMKQECVKNILTAMISLTKQQPDIFDKEDFNIATNLLQLPYEDIQTLTLKWLQNVCIMHENNRQVMVGAGIIKIVKPFIVKDNIKRLNEALILLRCLVLDDDIRVEFGCAHEHARQIANELILDMTNLLNEVQDTVALSELLLTIGALTVRQEFCTSIEEAGGLISILRILENNNDNLRLCREALKLIRALAGNDIVKAKIVEQGFAPIIKDILILYKTSEPLVVAALACISTLTLRVKKNSETFFDIGIANIIAECMEQHPKSKIVQRNAAWSIRNMVSRSREQCETWLSFGVEDLLNTALKEHPTINQDIKSALRDLGCKVELKEEWTGVAEKKILKN